MRLISVDIANFRVVRSAHLDFPDQLIGIIGPNGSGKSTIIEAVSWALYGHQVARSGKEEIKASFAKPNEPCEVSLAFEVHGEQYRVVRRLVGKSEKSEVELYRGAASESGGVSETRNYVGNLLGLDWRGFLTSFLARQSELNALTSLAPSKRREHLAGMLGIERLDKAIVRVKEDTRFDEERVSIIGQQLAARGAIEARVTELREHVGRLEAEAKRAAGAYTESATALTAALSVLREHQERDATCSRLKAEVDASERSLALLVEQEGRLRGELEQLGRAGGEIAELERRAAGLPAVKQELERLGEAESRAGMRMETERQVGLLRQEVQKTTGRMGVVGGLLERIATRLVEVPESVVDELERARVEMQALRDEQTRLATRVEGLGKDERKLQAQLEDIGKFGPDAVCDRCHRPFRADELAQFKEHVQAELAGVRQQAGKLTAEVSELKETGRGAAKKVQQLEGLLESRKELGSEQRVLEAEQKELRERLTKCDDQMKFLEGQLVELGEVVFDPARYEELRRESAELEAGVARLNQIRGSLGRVATAEAEVHEVGGRIAALRQEIADLQAQAAAVGFDADQLQEAEERFEIAQASAAQAHEESLRLSHELDLARQELQIKTDQLAEFERASEELEAARTRHYYGETLTRLFTDFRKYLIASIRPRLAELSSQLMDEMTAGRYPLVDLDEDYNLSVYDYGQFYRVERFSGGENDLANLCLRLAISLSLTESAGLERSFIILDEVFGSQDESRRDLIFQGLANLKGRFPQIILITHFEELKHKVETLVELLPTGQGWSEVRVNGEIA